MAAWFTLLTFSGVVHVARQPDVLSVVNPLYALRFLQTAGWPAMFVLGAILLAVTGAEALYADVGHFNKRIMRLDWFWMVLPALAINYRQPSGDHRRLYLEFAGHAAAPPAETRDAFYLQEAYGPSLCA
jgi:K+ transporter